MSRFILSPENIDQDRARITGPDVRHIVRVLRKRPGDAIEALLAPDTRLRLRILEISAHEVLAEIVDRETNPWWGQASNVPHLVLFQGLIRGPKMDLIVQKATELGVARLVPVIAERSVARVGPDQEEDRVRRWERIAREACKQCGRPEPPKIEKPRPIPQVLPEIGDMDVSLLFTPTGPDRSVSEIVVGRVVNHVGAIIGPEGGFTEAEEEMLARAGAVSVSLPGYVLRAETAAIAACALLTYSLPRIWP